MVKVRFSSTTSKMSRPSADHEVQKEGQVKSEAPAVKREYDEAFDLTGDSPRKPRRKRAPPETVDLTDD